MIECRENRELSWLKFNNRVLNQAKEAHVPIGEQLSFVSIFQSNLDEFFMVRMGSLYDTMLLNPTVKDSKTGMTAQQQFRACLKRVEYLYAKKDKIYQQILKKLEKDGWKIMQYDQLNNKEQKYFEKYFDREILPLVSPQVISKRQPFPFLNNKELYIVVQLESKKGKRKMGIVSCSQAMDERLMVLNSDHKCFVLVEDIIKANIDKIFEKYNKILACNNISNQREIAELIGFSLGKVNKLIDELIKKHYL